MKGNVTARRDFLKQAGWIGSAAMMAATKPVPENRSSERSLRPPSRSRTSRKATESWRARPRLFPIYVTSCLDR